MNDIQIFTDGGICSDYNIAVSVGIICFDKNEVISFQKITHNRDSDFAEIFAIRKALSRTYGRMNQYNMYDGDYTISLYTDSKPSIVALTSKYSICNKKNINRINILNEVKETMAKFDNPINFYHIKSHIPYDMKKDYYIKFCESNNADISFDEFLFIVKQNKKCDNLVKRELKKYRMKYNKEESYA